MNRLNFPCAAALIAAAVLALFASNARAANPWKLEAGQTTTNDTSVTPAFVTVNFAAAFSTPPVVVVLPTNEGADPAALRIRNVTTTSFEVAPVEPSGNDGPHASMTFHYVAATPGVHQLPTGETVAVGTHTTSSVQRGGGVGGPAAWDTVTFGATLSASASVVATIQTDNSETAANPGAPSVPWLVVTMRNPTASSVQMALERAEVAPGTVLAETIGYIAIAQGANGSFLDDSDVSTNWSAVQTPDNLRGWDNGCFTNTYSATAFGAPRVVASQTRRDGNNGGWARRCSLTGTTVGLTIDEDQFNDAERAHTTEAAGILAFSRSFHATFEGILAATSNVVIAEDPVNGTSDPLAVPGARARFSVQVESQGRLPIDTDTVSYVNALAPESSLVVTDINGPGSGPVRFTDGSTSSALTYTFTSLGSATDDIAFSSNGGLSFTYTPSPDADGADPAVTHFRVEPKGDFAGTGASANPSFTLEFDVLIE